MGRVLIALIRLYRRWMAPVLGAHCRFYPTCSAYALEAIRKHGCLAGMGYSMYRILRCQPFCKGGCDPVP